MNIRQWWVTNTSSYTSVIDNSEGSEPPWSLKVWATLEGQRRSEKGIQETPVTGEWGLVEKVRRQTLVWDKNHHQGCVFTSNYGFSPSSSLPTSAGAPDWMGWSQFRSEDFPH